MSEKDAIAENDLTHKLKEIDKQVETMLTMARDGKHDLHDDAKELDRLVREFKAQLGMSSFDKTTYQREYMRRKRAEDPSYRPLMRGLKDLPDWRNKFR